MSDKVVGLRQRLVDLRDDVLEKLAEGEAIDAGLLAVAANATVLLLTLDEPDPSHARTHESRGGDPKAMARAERDAGLRDLAAMIAGDLSAEARAAVVIGKVRRYRLASGDDRAGAERRALARIAASGVPLPGRDRLRKILGAQKSVLDAQTSPPASEQTGGHGCE